MGSPKLKSERVRELVAHNAKALVRELQISENELARRSGVSQKQINNLVHARTGYGVDALEAIARVAGLQSWMLLLPEFGDVVGSASRVQRVISEYLGLGIAEREAVNTLITSLSRK